MQKIILNNVEIVPTHFVKIKKYVKAFDRNTFLVFCKETRGQLVVFSIYFFFVSGKITSRVVLFKWTPTIHNSHTGK